MKKINRLGVFGSAALLAVVLTGCGSDGTNAETCIVQDVTGEYTVLDRKWCDDGGYLYASTYGGSYYPMVWFHSSSAGSFTPGSRVAPSIVKSGSAFRANDSAAVAKARSSSSGGLKVGSNKGGVPGTTKGFGGGSRGGSSGVG